MARETGVCCFFSIFSVSFLGVRSSGCLVDRIVSRYAIWRGTHTCMSDEEQLLRDHNGREASLKSFYYDVHSSRLYHNGRDYLTIIISQIAFQSYEHKLPFLLIFANKIHILNTCLTQTNFFANNQQQDSSYVIPTISSTRQYIHGHRGETNGVDRRRHNRYYRDRNERGISRAGIIFR